MVTIFIEEREGTFTLSVMYDGGKSEVSFSKTPKRKTKGKNKVSSKMRDYDANEISQKIIAIICEAIK